MYFQLLLIFFFYMLSLENITSDIEPNVSNHRSLKFGPYIIYIASKPKAHCVFT